MKTNLERAITELKNIEAKCKADKKTDYMIEVYEEDKIKLRFCYYSNEPLSKGKDNDRVECADTGHKYFLEFCNDYIGKNPLASPDIFLNSVSNYDRYYMEGNPGSSWFDSHGDLIESLATLKNIKSNFLSALTAYIFKRFYTYPFLGAIGVVEYDLTDRLNTGLVNALAELNIQKENQFKKDVVSNSIKALGDTNSVNGLQNVGNHIEKYLTFKDAISLLYTNKAMNNNIKYDNYRDMVLDSKTEARTI